METLGGILGGVGIFLLGMILLTEGLKRAAGGHLRSLLQRFARSPGSALLSGAAVTAAVQSSSATTLTTIGFVSAGLLTFPQAVGVIFGANLGTTSTGWLVSLLGFRVSLAAVAFPLVGIGALTQLLGRGRWSHAGTAIAGFGLIFVGIDVLQVGMEGLAERVDPTAFPGETLGGRVALVVIGGVMTVVMQSSSAAVATTLTGLHAGGLGLEQAAFLVIGQNMGTTVKAALAAIGGSVPVRRTAAAHILFNVVTGALALALLPLLLRGAVFATGGEDPAVAIALFHSSFNLLGVLVLFPVLTPFSRMVERMVPEPHPTLTRHLDSAVASIPSVGVEAARRTALAVARLLFEACARALGPVAEVRRDEGDDVRTAAASALADIRAFLGEVRTDVEESREHERHLSVLHAVDHLDSFLDALREVTEGGVPGTTAVDLAEDAHRFSDALLAYSKGSDAGPDPETMEVLAGKLAEVRRRHRAGVLAATARGGIAPAEAGRRIEEAKRLDRLGYHAWRVAHHLRVADPDREPEAAPAALDEDFSRRDLRPEDS